MIGSFSFVSSFLWIRIFPTLTEGRQNLTASKSESPARIIETAMQLFSSISHPEKVPHGVSMVFWTWGSSAIPSSARIRMRRFAWRKNVGVTCKQLDLADY